MSCPSSLPDPRALAERWRGLAEEVRGLGAEGQAKTLEKCAGELLDLWRERELYELSEEEAEARSGYSRSALYKMRQAGKLTNAGTNGSPKYLASELPRKAGKKKRGPRLADASEIADRAVRSRAETRIS